MAQVEAPFIIAVIREKEKYLLHEQNSVRMMHANSLNEAREILMSTPYGVFLADSSSVQDALMRALESEFIWLSELVDNANVLAFIAARYDALHVAQSCIALGNNEQHVPAMSSIGTISRDVLQAMTYTHTYIPNAQTQFWYHVIQEQKDAIQHNEFSLPYLFTSMMHTLERRLHTLAFSSLTTALAQHTEDRHAQDLAMRERGDILDATAYEWEWDSKAIRLAREYRFEPVGYDPIVAYWIEKEMEVKNINLLFAGLAGGFSHTEIASLVRPLAQTRA